MIRDESKPSDHSILVTTLAFGYGNPKLDQNRTTDIKAESKRYRFERIREDLMNNGEWNIIIDNLIENLNCHIENQTELDSWYNEFARVYLTNWIGVIWVPKTPGKVLGTINHIGTMILPINGKT